MKLSLLFGATAFATAFAGTDNMIDTMNSSGVAKETKTFPFQHTEHNLEREIGRALISEDLLKAVSSLSNTTFPHQCFVAVSRDPIEDREYPVVWCDFNVPAGLNFTAEIRDGECYSFNQPAKSEYQRNGQVSALFLPEVTEKEKRMGSFTHQYCARLDVIFEDILGGKESVFERRYGFDIAYNYKNNEGEEVSDDFTAALVDDNSDDVDIGLVMLVLVCGMIGGSIITLTMVAFIKGKRKTAAPPAKESENAEDAPVVPEDNMFV